VPAGLSAVGTDHQASDAFAELTHCHLHPDTLSRHAWMQGASCLVTACPVKTSQATALLSHLDLSLTFTALCLTHNSSELIQQLSSRGLCTLLRDSKAFLPPLHKPLENGLDLIIMAPPRELICLMLPYFTATARQLVCCLVPKQWWQQRQDDAGFWEWWDKQLRAGLATSITLSTSIWVITTNSIAAMERVWSREPDQPDLSQSQELTP
jgi:hypothetical protein